VTTIATTASHDRPAPGGAAGVPAGAPARRHLDAIDVVRMVMVSGVIAVHVVGFTTNPTDVLAGAANSILHINREVFFALTPFVLVYAYGRRTGWSLAKFWKRRYLFVGAPYLTWTVLYYLADGSEHAPWARALHRMVTDVAQGTARYHLYFLLVTMQVYAVFPLLLWLLKRTRRHPWALLGACAAIDLAFTADRHYNLPHPGFLSFFFVHADPLAISYVFFLVAGGVAAMHFDKVTGWVRDHPRAVGLIVTGGLGLTLASYCFDHYALGQNAAQAGEVFQPMVLVATTAAVTGLYALGVRWADRGEARRFKRTVAYAADASFGVFLVHPLLIQVLSTVAGPVTRSAADGRIPSWVVLPVDFLVVVPCIFVVAAVAVRLVRHTAFSLALTGRPRLLPGSAGGAGNEQAGTAEWSRGGGRRHSQVPTDHR
jgi:peptidoglycan/LPS O-acetylase OafA/YrhL